MTMESYSRPMELPQAVGEVDAVSWSQDQRIAVTSSTTVYILTLKRHRSSSSSLPITITTASGLPCSQNPSPPSSSSTSYQPSQDTLDFSLYFDPTLIPGHTPSAHWESGWSPACCDIIGGCLLSVLSVGGDLWVLTPPGSLNMKWHISTHFNTTNKPRYTTFHWFQRIIPAKNGVGGVSLIAMATKNAVQIVALTVPVHRNREAERQTVWEGAVEGSGWPVRLQWTSSDNKVHLAVGMNGGRLEVLSWPLPREWGGADEWAEPRRTVVWGEDDETAVRHIAWQLHPPQAEEPWLVFAKSSTLIAAQLPSVPSSDRPAHITIFGVHSRSVSGLACLHGNQFISCSLDGSVAKFSLGGGGSHESHVTSTGSHESHVTPTAVEVKSVCGEARMQGVAVSEHGLFAAFLTSEGVATSGRHKITSHLHLSPLLPLSHLQPQSVDMSWDIWEAMRLHRVTKQPLPRNLLSTAAEREEDELLMEHVLRVLEEVGSKKEEQEDNHSKLSLWLMYQWVETSPLAPPHLSHIPGVIPCLWQLENGDVDTETCPVCHTPLPFTNPRRETCANGHSWERCCVTLLLAISSLCGCCRGCGAVSHNPLSLNTSSNGSWFNQLLSKGRCTFCRSYFDLIT